MIGIDTNLLIRFVTNDDLKQADYATKLIEENAVFISKTVLLEVEWVLRYTYEFSREAILVGLKELLGLVNVTVEDPICVLKAMRWFEQGLDFADAMHLASATQVTHTFATLDKDFIKRAKKLNIDLRVLTMV